MAVASLVAASALEGAMSTLSTPCIRCTLSTRVSGNVSSSCSVDAISRQRGITNSVVLRERAVQRVFCQAGNSSPSTVEIVAEESIPEPVVQIDQHSEPNATVVEIEFGDRLGTLLDTTQSLRNLSLNVVRANVSSAESKSKNRFVITKADTGGKIEDPETLEAIRLTIINNLIYYHPEAKERVAGSSIPGKKMANIPTQLRVDSIEEGKRSILHVETADRPGLIVGIVKVLGDLSINVESAEIDTEGFTAKDEFYVTYRNEALNSSMVEVVVNTLRYFLDRPDIEAEDSY